MEVPHQLALAGPSRLNSARSRPPTNGCCRWAADGTWERILAAVLATADAEDDIDWSVSVDSTIVRAHQHAAGAHKQGAPTETSPTITHSDAPAAG